MSRSSVREVAGVLRQLYREADRTRRREILKEFIGLTGYHRKSALRIFSLSVERKPKAASGKKRGRPYTYEPAVAAALQIVWEAANCICSARYNNVPMGRIFVG